MNGPSDPYKKEVCKCGKSSVAYYVVGEDLYEVDADNVKASISERGDGNMWFQCNHCPDKVDYCDPEMVSNYDELITTDPPV